MAETAFLGALVFAVSAGVATFFAPCAFPLLPGYVGYYLGRDPDVRTGVAAAGAVAAGTLLSLGAVAAIAYSLGHSVTAYLPLFEPVVGVALVAVGGLTLAGRAPTVTVSLPARPESLLGFGAFGAAYALAAAGCVIHLFLGVLGQALTLPAPRAATVLAAYALAVATPLLGVTLLASVGVEAWREAGRYAGRAKQVAAVVMILAGVGQLYLSLVVLDVV